MQFFIGPSWRISYLAYAACGDSCYNFLKTLHHSSHDLILNTFAGTSSAWALDGHAFLSHFIVTITIHLNRRAFFMAVEFVGVELSAQQWWDHQPRLSKAGRNYENEMDRKTYLSNCFFLIINASRLRSRLTLPHIEMRLSSIPLALSCFSRKCLLKWKAFVVKIGYLNLLSSKSDLNIPLKGHFSL